MLLGRHVLGGWCFCLHQVRHVAVVACSVDARRSLVLSGFAVGADRSSSFARQSSISISIFARQSWSNGTGAAVETGGGARLRCQARVLAGAVAIEDCRKTILVLDSIVRIVGLWVSFSSPIMRKCAAIPN